MQKIKEDLRELFMATEQLRRIRAKQGRKDINLISYDAEEFAMVALSEIHNSEYELCTNGQKAYDLINESLNSKVEVKSVVGSTRTVESMKDKGASDKILVIWFNTNNLFVVDRVVMYDTDLVMSTIKEDGNKKFAFTTKLQNKLFESGTCEDLTTQFQSSLDGILKITK